MLKKLSIAAAIAVLSISAQAQTANAFYVGSDIGSTKVDGLVDNKVSYGAFGGYKFNENVAVELAYRQLFKTDIGPVSVDGTQTAVSVLGIVPVSKEFQVIGRLGYNQLKANASYRGSSGSGSQNGTFVGVGVQYQFTANIGARLEFQKPASDTKNFSAGVTYSF
ncbi:porin family protein [Undibacterium curvum]|uniref:Porin family protein n=1 Tax=Undibacterium curvum TaxID=2762294 RepID=A0ABR7A5E9_9BURK|nr:porin family protein [Undibacterium curvum]MBC3932135.1 porin family protein [Undibacterium curvum]